MRSRSALAALVLTVATGPLVACGGGGGDGAVTGRFGGLHTGICRAAAEAEAGDLAEAQATFDDHHVALHDLAGAAELEDRAVAASLLEAKQRVEADLRPETLRALVDPVGRAVEATGGTAPGSCP